MISATARKRFYKNVDVVSAGNGIFEVTVDSRKVKTPGGSVLTIQNEALALAVAHEWQAQDDVIQVNIATKTYLGPPGDRKCS